MIVNGIYVQRIFSDIFIESKKNVKGRIRFVKIL